MRKGVDYIGVGVGAVILNRDGKFLLLKRGPKSQNEVGSWGFPGGALEFGETIEEAIIREVKEELGIKIKPLKTLSAVNHRILHEKQHWLAVPYICQLVTGKPKILEKGKTSDLVWFNLKEVGKLKLTLVAKEVFRDIKEKYNELEDFF